MLPSQKNPTILIEKAIQRLPAPAYFDLVRKGGMTMAISGLIGSDGKFRALLDIISMVAPVDSAVLIQGETGTGKEVIARAIHEASYRRKNRFVALNCAAIPDTLFESELFGCEKAPLPALSLKRSADSNPLIGEHFSWTRLEIFRWRCSRNFCERFRRSSSSALGMATRSGSTCE